MIGVHSRGKSMAGTFAGQKMPMSPMVSDDGKWIAFQPANSLSEAGVGCAIYSFDIEKRIHI